MGELLVTGTDFMGMFTLLLDLHNFVKWLQKNEWSIEKKIIHCKIILLRLIVHIKYINSYRCV